MSVCASHRRKFVGSYTVAYTASFGAAWGAIAFANVDGIGLLRRMGFDGVIDTSSWSPRLVNAFIAMTIADLIEPIRLPLVVVATPLISRALRRGR